MRLTFLLVFMTGSQAWNAWLISAFAKMTASDVSVSYPVRMSPEKRSHSAESSYKMRSISAFLGFERSQLVVCLNHLHRFDKHGRTGGGGVVNQTLDLAAVLVFDGNDVFDRCGW